MAIWRNTTFHEHANENPSPNEMFGPGSTHLSRDLDIKDGSYLGRLQAAYDFLGYAVVLSANKLGTGGAPFYIHRVTPMPYPGLSSSLIKQATVGDLPAGVLPPDLSTMLYAMGISRTRPLGQPTGVNLLSSPGGTIGANYARARLTVEFTTLPYWIRSDDAVLATSGPLSGFPDEGAALASGWANTRYIQRHIEAFSRLLKIPYGMMQTPKSGKGTKAGVPLREGGANVTYTWMRVPITGPPFQIPLVSPPSTTGINFSLINSALGTINNATFDQFPAQTLLLDSYQTREYQGAFGEWLADVTFNMIFLPHPALGTEVTPGNVPIPQGTPLGWNYVYDVINQKRGYYLVSSDNAGTLQPFVTNDFSGFFRPPTS